MYILPVPDLGLQKKKWGHRKKQSWAVLPKSCWKRSGERREKTVLLERGSHPFSTNFLGRFLDGILICSVFTIHNEWYHLRGQCNLIINTNAWAYMH